MQNRLEMQRDLAPFAMGQVLGTAHDNRWFALHAEFAGRNNLKPSAEFTLDALKRNLRSGGSWGRTYDYPGCDHPSFFKRHRRAALVVVEPYRPAEVEELKTYAADKGLVLHFPPNSQASFWFPGSTYFIAITRPDFGEVKWIPSQLSFDDY